MSYLSDIYRHLRGFRTYDRSYYYSGHIHKVTHLNDDKIITYSRDNVILVTCIRELDSISFGCLKESIPADPRESSAIRRIINDLLRQFRIPVTLTSKRKVWYWSDGRKYNGPREFPFLPTE